MEVGVSVRVGGDLPCAGHAGGLKRATADRIVRWRVWSRNDEFFCTFLEAGT